MSTPIILIVEADHYIGKALQTALELTLPVKATVVEDPEEVKPFVVGQRPNLVIVDVYTRRFNAFDVIAGLNNDPKARGIPIIAMGPRGNQIELARAMGCADTLSLPFRIAELVSKMQRHLDVQPLPHGSDYALVDRRLARR